VTEAGKLSLDYFGSVSGVPKGPLDLVTDADVAVEEFLVERLLDQFPSHQFIAEESTGPNTEAIQEYCWVIDPLDGTVNFVMGIPFFSVSLALLHNGEPVLGWVYDPVREELYYAERGVGSFSNGQRLVASSDSSPLVPIGGSSGLLSSGVVTGLASPLGPMMQRFGKIRILGSQALHLCYVAAGRLRAAISWEARLWDDAAGALIAQEAGGRDVFPLRAGSRVLAGKPIHSVAAPPAVLLEILELLAEAHSQEAVD